MGVINPALRTALLRAMTKPDAIAASRMNAREPRNYFHDHIGPEPHVQGLAKPKGADGRAAMASALSLSTRRAVP
jgi:hypothetical protein